MPKTQRVAVALSIVNFALLVGLILSHVPSAFATQASLPVLRGRALEIVDAQGRVRASITINAPTTVGSTTYPENVLLRLTDPKSGPVVKLTAAANGAALGLSDDAQGGIQLYARDTGSFVRVVDRLGRTQVLRP